MARNGSGTQTSPGASFPAVTGTIIDSSKFNNIVNDINSEITKSIANDGQTPITANLPMSGFKHTGAADATATGQYLVYGQSSASLVSPALTGTPTAPTATAGTNTTQIATTAFVATSFAPLASPALTGSPTAPTQTAGDNSTKIATTAYVDSAGGSSKIQPITASVGSNALTLTLNATKLDFRSSTLSSGTVNTRTVSSPISVTVSSGSTLGTSNSIAARLAVLAIDNAGTVELAVVNTAGSVILDESTLISTTAEGGAGAAGSANVIYSTTARSSVPFRVVGYVEITEATAGTWASAPATIQGIGGTIAPQKLISSSAVASTSGTSIDFTSIPSWVKRVTVMLNAVSWSTATPYLRLQLGAGSVDTSGYSGAMTQINSASAASWQTAFSSGFDVMPLSAAADTISGQIIVSTLGSNIWAVSGVLYRSSGTTSAISQFSGQKTLSGTLDRVRVTTSNGTDTFDAGSINIIFE